jgi:Uma2 family endonuclease
MAIHDSPVRLTYDDYVHFPEDGRRHEIIGGAHYVTPAPNTRHQDISFQLTYLLGGFVRERGLGKTYTAPFDVVLSPTSVLQPDLVFVSTRHMDRLTAANLQGAPDLAVEILSDSTRGRDEITKRHLYAQHGVPEYWIIDPAAESVTVHRLEDGDYRRGTEFLAENDDRLESPLFPRFSLPLVDLFA